jgi:basic amino acid/polyamine antiporter, APA family
MSPLLRAMGRWTLAALVLNAVIGSSVFGLPSVMAGRLGAASPWAWLAAAAIIGLVVACFAEVSSRFGEAGGPYLYAREAFGRLAGIEMGWVAYLVRLTASATNANLFVIYLAEFWPGAEGALASRLVLAALIFPLAAVNYRGVSQGSRLSAFLIAAKLIPLAAFALIGLALAVPHPVASTLTTPPGWRPWSDAILLLMFAFGGFEGALVPLGEARDPRRDAPFALLLTLLVCTAVYTLAQVVVLASLPDPTATTRPLADAARVFMGPIGAPLMAGAALTSVYGYIAGAMVNVPRLTYAMAERGDLPQVFARVHPRFRTPTVSIVFYAALVWVLAATGSFLQNLALSASSRLFTYGLVCLALVAFRSRDDAPADRRPPQANLRLPWGQAWAAAGLLCSAALATRMSGHETGIMTATLVFGLANWLWVRRSSTALVSG